MTTLPTWTVSAANLPEHARIRSTPTPVAEPPGIPALVAGVTVYAYLTRPAAEGWGLPWLERGTAEVRFLSPVFADDTVVCTPVPSELGAVIEARVGGEVRATCAVTEGPLGDLEPMADGPALEPARFRLEGEWAEYGVRAGEDFGLYASEGIAHPALWPAMANNLVHRQLAQGSWIHTRSRIRHLGLATMGAEVLVEANEIKRFDTRSGERALLDVRITQDGRSIAAIEHEALIALN
ncbi:MAG: hypothetical protein R2710_23190 [Acidimicrobiales bacterium]